MYGFPTRRSKENTVNFGTCDIKIKHPADLIFVKGLWFFEYGQKISNF